MTQLSRPKKQTRVDRFEDLTLVRFVLKVENLLLLTPFILFWSIVVGGYLSIEGVGSFLVIVRSSLGLFLSIALYCCYLLLVLDYTARGFQTPPKMSGDLISTHKERFLKAALVISFFLSTAHAVTDTQGWIVFFVSSVLFLPIILSIIAIEDRFLRAVNPLVWFSFILVLKPDKYLVGYLISYLCLLASGIAVIAFTSMAFNHHFWLWVWTFLLTAFTAMSGLALFRSIGILIHANAAALGLPVLYSRDTQAAQEAALEQNSESDFLAQLYRLTEAGRTTEAWQLVQNQASGYSVTNLGAMDLNKVGRLWQVLISWPNSSLAMLVGQQYIEGLIEQQAFSEAWKVLEKCYGKRPNEFVLIKAKTVLTLAEVANNARQRQISIELLKRFPRSYPNYPHTAQALLRAAELCLTDRRDASDARQLLQQIRIRYPNMAREEHYLRLSALANEQ